MFPPMQQMGAMQNYQQLYQQFVQFAQSFRGNPQQMVMQLMQQNPQRYNQAVMMAQQLQQIPAFGAQDVSIK